MRKEWVCDPVMSCDVNYFNWVLYFFYLFPSFFSFVVRGTDIIIIRICINYNWKIGFRFKWKRRKM